MQCSPTDQNVVTWPFPRQIIGSACAKSSTQIDNDLLWYDLTNLLEEPQEGDAPKLHITLDYAVRPFDAVEKEYLELFEQYQYRETGDERR